MSKELQNIQQTPSDPTAARSKGGRPRGSGNKITVQSLLDQAFKETGTTFEEAIIRDWANAQDNRDLRYKYNQLLFNKVIADRHQVEVDETQGLANRQDAFLKALATIGNVMLEQDAPAGQDDK